MKLVIRFLVLSFGIYSTYANAFGYSEDYETCMKAANNQSQNIQLCQTKELKYQANRLDKIFKETLSRSAASEQVVIKKINAQWQGQRDLACGLKAKNYKKLNIANLGCALQMTSSRADMLEVQLTNKKINR
jgi:uncharacterized protein YecT (DUF1311 family)